MGVIIKDIQKNQKEIIRIEVSEFKGMQLINLRIWYQAIDEGGDYIYKPSQKGVALNIGLYNELKDAVEKIGEYIKDEGIELKEPETSDS